MEESADAPRWTPQAVAWTSIGLMLLPSGLALLAYAGGLFGSAAGADARTTALDVGMLLAALGNWFAPLAVGKIQLARGIAAEEGARRRRVLLNPWGMAVLLPALAFYAARSLREPMSHFGADQLGSTLLPAVLLAISALSRAAFEADGFLDRRRFGATSFPRTLKCAPGGTAVAVLVLGKPAAAVTATLELFVGDGEPQEYPAKIDPAARTPDGWSYRVSAQVPASPVPQGEDDGWTLSVEALSASGDRHFESVDIELRP